MINDLHKERLFLLQCQSGTADLPFVYDKDLDHEIRKIISRLNEKTNAEERKINNDTLNNLFESYKLALIRAVLSNINFINSSYRLNEKFEDLLLQTNEYININPGLLQPLLDELDYFSRAEGKSNEEFITLLFKNLSLDEPRIKEILFSDRYSIELKYLLFKLCCQEKNYLSLLITYLSVYSNEYAYLIPENDLFISEYCKTGEKGFEVALQNFLRSRFSINQFPTIHGIKLVSQFPGELIKWASRSTNSYKDLVEPILDSIPLLNTSSQREIAIKKLLNNWFAENAEISNLIVNRIRFRLIISNDFLDLFLDGAKKYIQQKIPLTRDELELKKKLEEFRKKGWASDERGTANLLKDANGEFLALLLLTPDYRFSRYIFNFINEAAKEDWNANNKERWKEFGDKIFNRGNFQRLPQALKHALITIKPFCFLVDRDKFQLIAPYCDPDKRKIYNGISFKQNSR